MTRKEHAQTYLDFRDNGYSVKKVMSKNLRLYILLILLGVLFLTFGLFDNAAGFAAAGGYFLSAVKRDWEWIKTIKKNWPLTEEVIHWEKVEKIASEVESGNDSN